MAQPVSAEICASILSKLRADYTFDESFLPSNFMASAHAHAIIPLDDGGGEGEFVMDSVLGQYVYRFPRRSGLIVNTSRVLTSQQSWSAVMKFKFDQVENYRRIFQMGDLTEDYGVYAEDGWFVFYEYDEIERVVFYDAQYATIGFTRDANRNVHMYVNGTLVQSLEDTLNASELLVEQLQLFVDDGSEESAGYIARFQLYDGALSATEMSNIFNQQCTVNGDSDINGRKIGWIRTIGLAILAMASILVASL